MSRRLALSQVVGESMIHIVEPVATQAVKFILARLGLTEMMKDEIYVVSDFKESSKSVDKDGNPKLITYRTTAKITPNVNPTNNKWEGMKTAIDLGNGNTIIRSSDAKSVKRPWSGRDVTDSNYSLFHDDETFTDLTEWCVGSTLTMEVKMDFQDLSPAQETLSKIFSTFLNGDMIGYVPIQYDYPIPKNIQNVLKYVYKLSGNEQTTEKFTEWLKTKSRGNLSLDVNRNDLRNKELVGLHNGAQAIFLVECSQDAPEVASSSRYTVTFNLTVQYARVNRIVMDYPIIIKNQTIDPVYVPMTPKLRAENKGPYQWQNKAVDWYWKLQYQKGNLRPIMFPWWDRWVMPGDSQVAQNGFRPIMIIAMTIDNPEDPEGFTSLNIETDLPGYKLSDDVMTLFKTAGAKALGMTDTFVNITVFAHDLAVDSSLCSFDGTTFTFKSRRIDPIYRIVLSINDKPYNMPKLQDVMEYDPNLLKRSLIGTNIVPLKRPRKQYTPGTIEKRDDGSVVTYEPKPDGQIIQKVMKPDGTITTSKVTEKQFVRRGDINYVWIAALRPKHT